MKTSLVFFLILPQKFSASYFLLSNSVEEVFRLLLQLIPPAVLVHTPFDSFRNFTTSLTSFLFWIFKLSFLPFLPWIFCIWCKQSWIIKTIFYFLNPKEAFQSRFCITFDKIDLLFLSWTFPPLAYFPDSCSLLISHMLLWQILCNILHQVFLFLIFLSNLFLDFSPIYTFSTAVLCRCLWIHISKTFLCV